MKIPKDTREGLWGKIEKDIQKVAGKKDNKFALKGKWKKYSHRQDGYKVYKVDGEWVNNNLSITFGHGGHGFVHEFIPMGEIWIALKHPKGCGCRRVRKDRKMSTSYAKSTTLHEIVECREMKKGKNFWHAHNMALDAERKAGILKDPYTEVY